MNTAKELHVIFGTGPVGCTVAAELLAKGKQVRIINRSGKAQVAAGAELIAGDAMDLATVRALCKSADVVYNCTNAPYTEWAETLPRLQANLMEGAATVQAKLIVTDTLYMYGETHGQPMTEATPHAATTRKGRIRTALAQTYLQAHRDGKVRVSLGRAADFFGPLVLNSALGDRVFPMALVGKTVQLVGNIDLPHSYSYMSDVARGLVILGEREEALGRDWLLPVGPAVTQREVCRKLGEQLGRKVNFIAVPKLGVRALGLFDTFMREYVEMMYQYTEPQIVDSSAFEQTFGLRATPLDEALRATIHWYQTRAQTVPPAV